jgi:hypothetical protein
MSATCRNKICEICTHQFVLGIIKCMWSGDLKLVLSLFRWSVGCCLCNRRRHQRKRLRCRLIQVHCRSCFMLTYSLVLNWMYVKCNEPVHKWVVAWIWCIGHDWYDTWVCSTILTWRQILQASYHLQEEVQPVANAATTSHLLRNFWRWQHILHSSPRLVSVMCRNSCT